MIKRHISPFMPWAVTALIGLCAFILAWNMPYLGDDLGYAWNYSTHYAGGLKDLPLIMARHWLHVNSRMADMLNSVWLCMIPRWSLAAMCSLMTVLYFHLTMQCARLRNQSQPHAAKVFLTALLLFTMPWWDSFFLFVCQFNYVWSSALTLATLAIVTSRNQPPPYTWAFLPIALVAGWMHEAAGMPTAAGIILWLVINRNFKSLPSVKRIIIIAYCTGAIISVTSPASWSRAAHVQPNDPLWLLLLKSDFYALLLLMLITAMAMRCRRQLARACQSPWIIFATAALASMCISGIGGIVGRSGWFAQTFAIIALTRPEMPWMHRMSPPPSWIRAAAIGLSLLMAAHMFEVTRWQLKADAEIRTVTALYQASSDGTVTFDPIQRYDFPWWNLCKNKGVPDADDSYLLLTMDRCIGHDRKKLRVIPNAAMTLGHPSKTAIHIGKARITSKKPNDTDANGLCMINDTVFTVVPFTSADSTSLYYISPRILDPGDR